MCSSLSFSIMPTRKILFLSLLLFFLSQLPGKARAQGPVCIITNEIIFTQDVGTSNCTMGTNVSLCSLYEGMGTGGFVTVAGPDNQNITSYKIFSNATGVLIGPGPLTLTASPNPIAFQGTSTTLFLNYIAPATFSRIITLPDPGLNGAQLLYTQKATAQTVSTSFIFSAQLTLSAGSSQLLFSGSNSFIFSVPSPAAPVTLTFGDPGVSSTGVIYTSTTTGQTISGAGLTLTNPLTITASSGQLLLGTSPNQITITSPAPLANAAISLPDPGTPLGTVFMLSNGAIPQTVNTVFRWTSSQFLQQAASTPQFIVQPSGGNQLNVLWTGPAVSGQTMIFPDPGNGTSRVILSTSVSSAPQIIATPVQLTFNSGAQLMFGASSAFIAVTAVTPASSFGLGIYDISAVASSSEFQLGLYNTIIHNTSFILSTAMSGQTFLLGAGAAEDKSVVLPAVAASAGVNYKFIVVQTLTNEWDIKPNAVETSLHGFAWNNGTVTSINAGSNCGFNFNAVQGDSCEIWTGGDPFNTGTAKWILTCWSTVPNGIFLT